MSEKVSEQEAARVLADLKRKQDALDTALRVRNAAIVEAMQLKGVSRQEMATMTGLSVPRLYQIRDGRN
ncbi:hypothetical protein ACQCSX_04185 [Pseudarthrobacter sp. P1]|uniref:hypothetical protein n=1 Tax=Pseudarthrobacter sp. P1 TaxID=3418418 RepID=UPI003CEE5AE4